jgi:uncharacterized protein
MSEPRFAIDTNVLLSAALFKQSVPRQALNKALADGQILMSAPVLTELQDVFRRSRFDKYLSTESRAVFLNDLQEIVENIEIIEAIAICRDPKDNKYLELAVSGNATCIISGDRDLLILHPFRGISILTPADFLILNL